MKKLVQKRPVTDDGDHKNEIETPEIIGGDGGRGIKKILLFFLFMISVINSYSQTFDLSILTSGKWNETSPVDPDCITTFHFDNSYCYMDIYITESKKINSWTCKYYLSDTKPSTFDKSKVGKNKNGKYLVMLSEVKWKEKIIESMSCYKITNVAQDKLTMVNCLMSKYDIYEKQTFEWTKIIDYE